MRGLIPFLLSCSCLYSAVVDGVATVSTVEGTGEIVAQASKPLLKGVTFTDGNRVKTADKSSAIVLLSNGSKVLVNPNAVVHFKVLKQEDGSLLPPDPENKSQKEKGASITEIEVESGKVIGDVKKLVPNSVFTLKTPVGTVTIKGTVFSVAYQVNKDGTASFAVGCLVGRVSVQMADPKIAPISLPAGKQLTMTAPQPPAQQQGGEKPPEKQGDKPKGEDNKGEQPKGEDAPPPPPMKMEVAPLPPAEMKAMVLATPDRPPPPPNAPPPPPPAKADALDNIMQKLEEALQPQQVNPSPTGG
jgi:hypothetical protein